MSGQHAITVPRRAPPREEAGAAAGRGAPLADLRGPAQAAGWKDRQRAASITPLMKHTTRGLLGGAALLLMAGCTRVEAAPARAPSSAAAGEAPDTGSADRDFAEIEREYAVYFMRRFPVVATYLGGAAFDESLADIDTELRDHSEQALAEEDARWAELLERFRALEPARLSARRQIDRRVALAQLEFLLHQHRVLRHQQRALDSYVDEPFRGVDWQIQGMTATGPSTVGSLAEWQQVLARARAVPAYLRAAEEQLAAGVAARNTPDPRVLAQYGLRASAADAEFFAKTLPALAERNLAPEARDEVLGELRRAGAEAAAAYTRLRGFVLATFYERGGERLRPEHAGDRFAAGAAEYDWALRNNLGLEATGAQLHEEARPIIERTRQEMIELASDIARRRGWSGAAGEATVRRVFDALGKFAPETDAEMLAGYIDAGRRLVDYSRSTGLFEVPADYRLDVTITPPPLRASIDGAAYYPAPPFKRSGVGRFYVTPTGDDREMLRLEHNRAALADLAAHEGFPGHDWHYKVMAQHPEEISAVRWLTPGAVEDSSSMWQDSMAAEGWALYSEGLLAEAQPGAPRGFYTPEERLYQLRGKLYRDVRVRVDTGIHIGRLSFEDAVTLFSELVDFLPGPCTGLEGAAPSAKRTSCEGARGAITRYARWPTQAITYRLGRDQIVELRGRAEAELGAAFSAQRFHLELMKQGTIPVHYFADELLRRLRE